MRMRFGILTTVGCALTLSAAAGAQTVTLGASKDNTLYQSVDGFTSNGAGQYFFAGTTVAPELRRGLIAFDIAGSVPAGATITSVSLQLNMSRSISGDVAVGLHRAAANWGEAASDALGEEGTGAPAQPGDATWIHRFSPGSPWASAGGDFAATASATTTVGARGFYTWSGPGLVSDVQSWLSAPAGNFGWVVIADEATVPSAKRFDTKENPIVANRPRLTVSYTIGGPCGSQRTGDTNCDGAVNFDDITCFVAAIVSEQGWRDCIGAGATCTFGCVCDIDEDGSVDFDDISPFVGCLIGGC